MIDSFARIAFLKKIHLFHGMEDEELALVADQLQEQTYTSGEVIYRQNQKADNFYLIYRGSVNLVSVQKGKEVNPSTLVANDYFGHLDLLERHNRTGTATALTDTQLLILSQANFVKLLKTSPDFQSNLDIALRTRQLARSLQFRWLAPGEVIYFLARKHPIILVRNLIGPLLVLFVPSFFLFWWATSWQTFLMLFLAGTFLVLDVLWAIWLIVDWGNDYYIVTSQRVVWLEKVIAVYDSRQESPLNTILAVAVETSLLGRWFDFGDVVVRTFVGKIIFKSVSRPKQAQHMVQEYWDRTKNVADKMEKDAMVAAIRKNLGIAAPAAPQKPPPPKADFPKQQGLGRIARFFGAERLRLRYEQGDSVIYRKHWFVLFQQAWIPLLGLLFTIGVFLYRLYLLYQSQEDALVSLQNGASIDAYAGALFMVFFIMLAWLIYEVVDWSNDIYQVTNEQIIDMDKKPLGTQTRNVSQLENILGTESERVGLLGEMFNYGNVYITVGGTKLTFENVIDPPTVQSDIDRRRMAQKARKEEKDRTAKREQMAEWLAIYHQNADKFKRDEDEQKKKSE